MLDGRYGAMALWAGLVLPGVVKAYDIEKALDSVLTSEQFREELCDEMRSSWVITAHQKIDSNRFLGSEKKAMFKRYFEQVYNNTQLVPVVVDEILAMYSRMLYLSQPNRQKAIAELVKTVVAKVNSAGISYLADADRRLVLEEQVDVMGHLADPYHCVLYANGQLTLDYMAQNLNDDFKFLQTISNKELKIWLDTRLNIISLGSMHKAKSRFMTRDELKAMNKAFNEAVASWGQSHSTHERILLIYFLSGSATLNQMCSIGIILRKMSLDAEGDKGKMVRSALFFREFENKPLGVP